eukprot:15993499-Heterocapsa_arctica.AAC.1
MEQASCMVLDPGDGADADATAAETNPVVDVARHCSADKNIGANLRCGGDVAGSCDPANGAAGDDAGGAAGDGAGGGVAAGVAASGAAVAMQHRCSAAQM